MNSNSNHFYNSMSLMNPYLEDRRFVIYNLDDKLEDFAFTLTDGYPMLETPLLKINRLPLGNLLVKKV